MLMLGPAQKAELLEAVYDKLGIPAAAEHCHLKISDVLDAADEDQEFAANLERAMERLTPLAEQALFERAVNGVKNYVVNQGRVVFITGADGVARPLVERKYSDGLLTKFLEARKRDTYGPKVEVTHQHSGYIAVPVMSAEELQKMLMAPGDDVEFVDADFEAIPDLRPSPVTDQEIEANYPLTEAEAADFEF